MKIKKILIICVVVIALIAIAYVGVYRYFYWRNKITTPIAYVTQNPVDSFNAQFTMYLGKQSGSNVKALMTTTISVNREQSSEPKEARLVSIRYDGLGGELEDVHIVPTMENIKQEEMLEFKSNLDKDHYYTVYAKKRLDGIIDGVIIYYQDPESVSEYDE